MGVDLVHRADSGDPAIDDQHGSGIVDGLCPLHRQHDAATNEHARRCVSDGRRYYSSPLVKASDRRLSRLPNLRSRARPRPQQAWSGATIAALVSPSKAASRHRVTRPWHSMSLAEKGTRLSRSVLPAAPGASRSISIAAQGILAGSRS